MATSSTNTGRRKNSIKLIYITLLFVMSYIPAQAQTGWGWGEITITAIQGLNFGTFCPVGAGGTVIVSASGARSYTGNVILLPSYPTAAQFYLESNKNLKVWYLTVSQFITLTREGGGGSMELQLGTPDHSAPPSFNVKRYSPVIVSVGGTLYVRSISANPAGTYSGTFDMTINYY